MGPSILFDKSFLQSLSLDESVWFGHYFMPVISPLFYVETLADLSKSVRMGRTPEQEVGIIADKFPEKGGVPCMHHAALAIQELLGLDVPMDGRILIEGGHVVERGGKQGVIHQGSLEAEAFLRWQQGEFLEIERGMAKNWRSDLENTDLGGIPRMLQGAGINTKLCKSLKDVHKIVRDVVSGYDKRFRPMELAIRLLGVPSEHHEEIHRRWSIVGYPPLSRYAPFTAHVLSVALFMSIAFATDLISAQRPSNVVDLAYLNYLPLCRIFVSTDKLHAKCAPLFLRSDQDFVWGPDLKTDLARINQHFSGYSEDEKERGIMEFAEVPPNLNGSLVRRLHERCSRRGIRDRSRAGPSKRNHARDKELLDGLKRWQNAPTSLSQLKGEPEMLSLERTVHRKKGSWWQLPKDLP